MRRIITAGSIVLILLLSFTFFPIGVDSAAAISAFESMSTQNFSAQALTYTAFKGEIDNSKKGANSDQLVLYFPVNTNGVSVMVTSPFGLRNDPFNRGELFHTGVDFGAPEGTELKACVSGVVAATRKSVSWGNTIIIMDPETHLFFRYAHMQELSPLKQGAEVSAGQTVGKLGNTGDSTGAHLHFEIFCPINDNDFMGTYFLSYKDATASTWEKKLGSTLPTPSSLNYVVSPFAKNIVYRDANFPGKNLKWEDSSWQSLGVPTLLKT